MSRVLLVEDDVSLGQTLSERLQREGLTVEWAKSVAESQKLIGAGGWDLAILDVKLPDGSGFGIARQIKRSTTTPVMFMTALNSAESRLEGYEIGGDEYLPKPFHLKEFLIRVRHVLSTQRQRRQVAAGDRTIDLDALVVTQPDGRALPLQTRDGKVLALLIQAAPRVIERTEILDRVWGEDRFPTSRSVDNAIVRLRQALGDDEGILIRSVRGVGYQWFGQAQP
jgi:DNA-binding response OmpR family regulator